MWRGNNAIELSASDLVGHLNCRHLTNLDLAVADGRLKKPQVWDPLLDVLRERGARHEQEFIEHLVNAGHRLTVVNGRSSDRTAASQTIDAMRSGADVVVQGALQSKVGAVGRISSGRSARRGLTR